MLPMVGEMINLIYTGSPVVTYNWIDDKDVLFSNLVNPVFTIQNQNFTSIYLYVQNQYGCIDSISKNIITSDKVNIWVPNSFTPNEDGMNDVFKLETATDLDVFNFYIYNRWGQLIFESTNINYGWDGKYMNEYVKPDVYIWTLIYSGKNSKVSQRKEGTVNVIR